MSDSDSITVLSRDGIQFNISSQYQQDSGYFDSIYQYDRSPSSILSVPYDHSLLVVIHLNISDLDNNQIIESLHIDRFFNNQSRIDQLEYRLVTRWVNGFYLNVNPDDRDYLKNMVIEIIYSNPVCGTYIYVNGLQPMVCNPVLSLLENEKYWVKIRSHMLSNIHRRDLLTLAEGWNKRMTINDKLSNNNWLSLIERFEGLPEFLAYGRDNGEDSCELGIAANYYAILNHQPCDSGAYNSTLLGFLRYEDMNSDVWNGLYQRIIDGRISCLPDLMYNTDDRVITKLMRLFRVVINSDPYYKDGNPAVIKALNLDPERVITNTIRLDSFLSVLSKRVTGAVLVDDNPEYDKIIWYIFVNNINVEISHLYEFLDRVIDNNRNTNWLWDILDRSDKIELIPVLRLYWVDKSLAHLMAEMGGRIKLNDIGDVNLISANLIDFMLSYEYRLDEEDIEFITDNIGLHDREVHKQEIDRLIECLDEEIEFEDYDSMVTINPVPLHDRGYAMLFCSEDDAIRVVDEYKIGLISLDEFIERIVGRDIQGIIDYLINYDPNRQQPLSLEERRAIESIM